MLGLAAIAGLGVPNILTKLFSLSKDNLGSGSGIIDDWDGSITEQSKRAFAQARPIPLVLGATAGVIAAFVAGWNNSNRALLGAWVRESL